MSTTANPKAHLAPNASVMKDALTTTAEAHKTRRSCGFCKLPLAAEPPVLLKSGQSVHLTCYLLLRKNTGKPHSN
ncbi:MAG TPA: hypothetical protein VGS27_36265 [Candidatus Sulfotelmatobacter sp.]|nr:hypothetical protein [Candidatus Sulfotelmatobacter sp.]